MILRKKQEKLNTYFIINEEVHEEFIDIHKKIICQAQYLLIGKISSSKK
tara:strand:- start:209 stop:355 length:147 start_codon:yes stop_codon:yes gene_type:complete